MSLCFIRYLHHILTNYFLLYYMYKHKNININFKTYQSKKMKNKISMFSHYIKSLTAQVHEMMEFR